jgi:hypothetical protein
MLVSSCAKDLAYLYEVQTIVQDRRDSWQVTRQGDSDSDKVPTQTL